MCGLNSVYLSFGFSFVHLDPSFVNYWLAVSGAHHEQARGRLSHIAFKVLNTYTHILNALLKSPKNVSKKQIISRNSMFLKCKKVSC